MWDPEVYARHEDERSRPFFDLTRRIQAEAPAHVADLGCGTGALTATLAERWPGARVEGVDSSEAMLADANRFAEPGRIEFTLGDLRDWAPAQPVDVIVSNAAFQWAPEHVDLLPRFVDALRPGGWLAFQVPGNFGNASHQLLAEQRQSPRWRAKVGMGADRHLAVLEPSDYLGRLAALGCTVDAWETTYLHLLDGADPVLDWIRGTALRPVLAALAPDEADEFCAELGARLRLAYRHEPYGTVFPFRRIFVVARRAEA